MLKALSPFDGRYKVQQKMNSLLLFLILLLFAGVARADLVGHHAGANPLLLSGDGKTAFTSDGEKTRVWNVVARREGATLPSRALAASGDGKRALCVSRSQGFNSYVFWRLAEDGWQRGTEVKLGVGKLPLLDAVFIGDEAMLMWLGRVERFASDGTKRTSRQFDEGDRLALGKPKTSPPVSALSPDGKRLVLWDRGWARVCDTTTGKRLTPLYEPKQLQGHSRKYWFSPDSKFVLESVLNFQDSGYDPTEGPPIVTHLAIYNARSGVSLRTFEDVGSFNFPFWPKDNYRSLLFQVRESRSKWKLERRDARTNAILPLNLSKPGLPERWVINLTFANNGKSYVALDEKGDIWAEQVKPN